MTKVNPVADAMTDEPRRKAGRQKMDPAKKKRHVSLKLSPLVFAFLKSDDVGKYQASPTVDEIIKRSKRFKDWKRAQD